jgi:diaminopimelate decarboxylase
MDHFGYREGDLYCEDVSLDQLAARVGTPAYVYSKRTFEGHYSKLFQAFAGLSPTILFSVKSCGNLNLLRLLVRCGAGMDVVSGGELFRAMLAGTPAEKIAFAGVGKTDAEIRQALRARIGWMNVESEQELEAIERLAREIGVVPRVAVRINPDIVDARTHEKTTTGHRGSKFGIDFERMAGVFERFGRSPHLALHGLHFHLGSPLYSGEPHERATVRTLGLVETLRHRGFSITALNIGGGFMADYGLPAARAPEWREYADPILEVLRPFVAAGGRLLLEPGRSISANAGVLLTRVLYTKRSGDHDVAVVDTGMGHFIRPALYDAVHFMWPARVAPEFVTSSRDPSMRLQGLRRYDVVGPICESTDRLAEGRALPPLERGDLLCIFSAGAYGMVMASQYNAIPRPPEVLVDGTDCTIIRRRETYEDLVVAELDPRPI